jgi:hypothetical protein
MIFKKKLLLKFMKSCLQGYFYFNKVLFLDETYLHTSINILVQSNLENMDCWEVVQLTMKKKYK